MKNKYFIQLLVECFGTCILILFGESGIANYKFTGQTSHSTFPIAFAFGIGVYTALIIAGPITGAHINPAVSISLMTVRKIRPIECIFYVIGQILGAFIGASLVYFIFLSQFNKFDGGIREMIGPNGTADIFFTMPDKGLPHWNTFIDQIICTSILMISIMALTNNSIKIISEFIRPFAFVIIVMGIICSFSINAGAAMNPARDLGPRLFSSFIYGWNNVFCIDNYFFIIPIIGPIIGGIIGVWIYQGYYLIIKDFQQINHSQDNHQNKINRNNFDIHDNNSIEIQEKF